MGTDTASAATKKRLSESLFRLHREPVGNVGRAGEPFQDLIADQATKLARLALQRRDLDAPITRLAFWTLNVGFLHAQNMLRAAVQFNSVP